MASAMHRQETVDCLKKFNARRKLKVSDDWPVLAHCLFIIAILVIEIEKTLIDHQISILRCHRVKF